MAFHVLKILIKIILFYSKLIYIYCLYKLVIHQAQAITDNYLTPIWSNLDFYKTYF